MGGQEGADGDFHDIFDPLRCGGRTEIEQDRFEQRRLARIHELCSSDFTILDRQHTGGDLGALIGRQ
jgi:hypothetical protein